MFISPLPFAAVLLSLSLLIACSTESGSIEQADSVDHMADKKTTQDTEQQNADPGPEEWMALAEQARQQAGELGYEWNTTMPLIEKGSLALKQGDEAQATALFREAKKQAELAIAQARYADENWQMLIPKP